jgi:hypothetical protein
MNPFHEADFDYHFKNQTLVMYDKSTSTKSYHDITEIMLKVALNTITSTISEIQSFVLSKSPPIKLIA